jgi:predicted dehydrogenase
VRRLRLGMVGGGQGALIGTVHRMAARLDDRYELVSGALSSDAARAHASAAALYIAPDRSYDDFRAMARAEAGRLDVVSIVTPNHVHAAAAMAFLEAGIHVMCDKPLTHTLEAAEELAASVARSGCLFGLTHNYTGYPMVRQAREMVAAGALGAVRVVQVEYSQGWLATNLEASGQKQAAWRTDPARSGAGGALGDIGTHAFNLAEFVTGLRVERLAADLSSFVAGRRVDDNAHILLRFAGGAKGMLFASQVAVGCDNALKLRIFGEKGSLTWQQEGPETLTWGRLGEAPTMLTRGGPGLGDAAAHATRLPGGHPEGYLEGFAQIYSDMAEQISARIEGRVADPRCLLVPGIAEGLRGMRFIAGAVASSGADAGWVSLG